VIIANFVIVEVSHLPWSWSFGSHDFLRRCNTVGNISLVNLWVMESYSQRDQVESLHFISLRVVLCWVALVNIDQFSLLDLNKTRILGYYGQGSKFFDREILVSTARLCPNPVKYFMLLRGCLCARTCW
jgi:hypothetical protein